MAEINQLILKKLHLVPSNRRKTKFVDDKKHLKDKIWLKNFRKFSASKLQITIYRKNNQQNFSKNFSHIFLFSI